MSTLITAAILLLVTAGLITGFVFINKRKVAKRHKDRLDFFNRTGETQGLAFSSQEVLEKNIMGLDGLQQIVLILEFAKTATMHCIRIAEVATCIIRKEYEKINTGTEKKERIEQQLRSVELQFSFINKTDTINVSFYDSNVNHIFEKQELETKARHWEAILSKMITKKKFSTA